MEERQRRSREGLEFVSAAVCVRERRCTPSTRLIAPNSARSLHVDRCPLIELRSRRATSMCFSGAARCGALRPISATLRDRDRDRDEDAQIGPRFALTDLLLRREGERAIRRRRKHTVMTMRAANEDLLPGLL